MSELERNEDQNVNETTESEKQQEQNVSNQIETIENSTILEKEELATKEKRDLQEQYLSKSQFQKFVILGLVLMILLSVLSSCISIAIVKKQNSKVVVYQPVENNQQVIHTSTTDISDIVEAISSQVVEVYTEKAAYNAFLGQYVTEGAGSGVVYSKDGYIITNNHVIDGATSVKVKTTDGKEYEAKVIAADAVSDIAVLKINADNLNAAILSTSASLKVGESCIAIGNPLGTLGGSVTTGIISALSREIVIDGQKMTLLQTNTAINPGNSGGGLFNAQGQLIGIVNAKSSGSDIEGIGFAIPVDYVKEIVQQLIEHGYVLGRPSIGIKGTSIESIQSAFSYGVSSYGVYINEVVSSEAKKAGLLEGDLIIGINDEQVSSFTELKTVLNQYKANDEVTIIILRGKNQLELPLVLQQKTE